MFFMKRFTLSNGQDEVMYNYCMLGMGDSMRAIYQIKFINLFATK